MISSGVSPDATDAVDAETSPVTRAGSVRVTKNSSGNVTFTVRDYDAAVSLSKDFPAGSVMRLAVGPYAEVTNTATGATTAVTLDLDGDWRVSSSTDTIVTVLKTDQTDDQKVELAKMGADGAQHLTSGADGGYNTGTLGALVSSDAAAESRLTSLETKTQGLDVTNPMQSFIDSRNRGLVGDGVTDNAPRLQDMIDDASANGQPIIVPAGEYRFDGAVFARDNVTLDLATGAYFRKNYATQGAFTDGLGLITNETGAALQGFAIVGGGVIDQTPNGGGKLLSLWCDDMRIQCGIGVRRVRPGTGDGWAFMLGGDRMVVDAWGTADPDTGPGHGGLDGVHIIGGEGMNIMVRNVRSGDDSLAFVPVESLTGSFAAWNHRSIIGARFQMAGGVSTHGRNVVAGIVANALGAANTASIVRDIDGVIGGLATNAGGNEVTGTAAVAVIANDENGARNQIRDIRFRGSVDPGGTERTVGLSNVSSSTFDIRIDDETEDVARIHNTTDCTVKIVTDMSGGSDTTSDICLPTGTNTRLTLVQDVIAPDTDGASRWMMQLGQAAANPMIDCDVTLNLLQMGDAMQAVRVGAHYSGRITVTASEKTAGASGTVGINLDAAANAVVTADCDLSLMDIPLRAQDGASAGGNVIARGIKGLAGRDYTSPVLNTDDAWGLHTVNLTGCAAQVIVNPGSATITDLQVSKDRGATWRSIGAGTRVFELPPYHWVRSQHTGGTVQMTATVL